MRKIMVEVTPQEYEKIQAGKLNTDDMTVAELINQLVIKLGKPVDCELLWDKCSNNLTTVTTYQYKHDEYQVATLITRTVEHRGKDNGNI
jgi:hypothetical protein